ncbi:MAG: hypothetical protein HY288_06280 [Planctomycetia bacterium]|nr:hypothetical protein [Planctomycetia bacterium]
MFLLRDLLAGVELPIVLTAGTLAVGWFALRHRHGARDSRSWAGPLALGVGFAGGYWALFGLPAFPPLDAIEWLFLLTPGLVLLGLLDSLGRVPLQVRVVSIAASAPASMLLLSWPLLNGNNYDSRQAVLFATATMLLVGWIAAMDGLAARVSAAQLSAILFCAAAPAALVLLLSGSQRLGQIGGVLAATQFAGSLVNYALGPAALGRGVIVVFGVLFGGLLLSGYSYAELRPENALMLLAAPLMSWLALLLAWQFRGLPLAATQLALVLVVAGSAVAQAMIDFTAD